MKNIMPVCRFGAKAAAVSLSALLLSVSGSYADEYPEMTFRSAQIQPPTGFLSESHQWWADELEKRTNGKVKVEIFWSGSLVAARDIPSAVASGAADIGNIPSTYDPSRTRLWMTLDMPMNVRDSWCGISVSRELALENEALAAELARNRMVQAVGYYSGFQHFISNDSNPVTSIDDLQGRRMRSYGGARVAFLENLGITPVFMGYGDIYEAIERGVVDGSADVTIYLTDAFKHYEIAKHMLIANSGVAVAAPSAVFNADVWNDMPDNLRQLLIVLGRDHDIRYIREFGAYEANLLEKFQKEHGMVIHEVSDEERAVLEKAAASGHEKWFEEAAAQNIPAREFWNEFQSQQRECEAEVAAKGYPWER